MSSSPPLQRENEWEMGGVRSVRRVDDQFQTYYERSDKVIWVAEIEGKAAGYIWMQPMYDPHSKRIKG